MINIHKGQYFMGSNNQKYMFLSYKNPNIIYCVDENFKDTNEILLFDLDFIQTILDDYNEDIKKMSWYFESPEELENVTLKEKLDVLITNTTNDFKSWEDELNDVLNLDIRIKKICDLVKGKAHYSSTNQFYEIIGFIVETETYENKKKTEENKGIFAIYHSKCDELAPMTFFYQDKKDKNRFYNKGTFDDVKVDEILISEKEINKFILDQKYVVPKLESKNLDKGMS